MNTLQRRSMVVAFISSIAVMGAGGPAAGAVCEIVKVDGQGAVGNIWFGSQVAVDGDVVIVGAPKEFYHAGAAYVYRFGNGAWALEQRLTASDGASGDDFGSAVGVSGTVAIVGAPNHDTTGAAYLYRWNGSSWGEEQKLVSTNPTAESFGRSVAVDGDIAVAGDPYSDNTISNDGDALVFRSDGSSWSQETQLVSPTPGQSDLFGVSVSISGSRIIVGAIYADVAGTSDGSAFIFRFTGFDWTLEDTLTASDSDSYWHFGGSVSIAGEFAVVGADNAKELDSATGAAYVYRYVGSPQFWVEDQRLLSSSMDFADRFGISACISGDRLIVGSDGDDHAMSNAGSAEIYWYDGADWIPDGFLTAGDAAETDSFGCAVAIAADFAVVGADGVDQGPDGAHGAAYLFGGVAARDCNGNGTADTCDIAMSGASDLNANLVPDDCTGEHFAWNETAGSLHPTIENAIDSAQIEDDLVATTEAFQVETVIDFGDRRLSLESLGAIDQPAAGLAILADGALLAASTGSAITLAGELRLEALDAAELRGFELNLLAGGEITCGPASSLELTITNYTNLGGITTIHEDAMLAIGSGTDLEGALTIYPNGTLATDGSARFSGTAIALAGARVTAFENITVSGTLIMTAADLETHGALFMPQGTATLNQNEVIVADTGWIELTATLSLSSATMFINDLLVDGVFNLTDSELYTSLGVTVDNGVMNCRGDLFADMLVNNELRCHGNTTVVGDYVNNGTTIVQIGTLTIIGTLTNNGTIIGTVVGGVASAESPGTASGDGVHVFGHYVTGVDASLLMPGPLWRLTVQGDFDMAIDGHDRYDMAQAELALSGLAGSLQSIEVMSTDIGGNPAGLDRTYEGHFPIGTLRVGAGPIGVHLVDDHDNDDLGQDACEAIYVRDLIIEPGAFLVTNGCRVFYRTLTDGGSVDDPDNLVLVPDCEGDTDFDGLVGIDDIVNVVLDFGTDGSAHNGDVNFSGAVNIDDIVVVILKWGSCSE